MKKILLAIVGAVLILGACSDNKVAPAEKLQVSDITIPDTYDGELASASYKKYCASCHGVDLQGAGAYQQPITGFSKEEVYIFIVQGGSLMPGNMVSGEEAENVAAWIADQ